jgi:DNA-binding PadR family transcriptional regulator
MERPCAHDVRSRSRDGDLSALSTKHVVLGLLVERPGYGYDLQLRFQERFRFLSLSEKVTYKVIDQLKEDGWIERVGIKHAGQTERGAPRVIYGATAAGREEFSRWIAEPCEIGIAREEVHVKVVLSQPPDWPRVIELTEKLEKTCLAAMHELQANTGPTFDQLADPEIPWDVVAAVLVDDAECTRLQGMIDWLQRARIVVRHRMDPPAQRTGRRG